MARDPRPAERAREAGLRELAALMRERASLAPAPVPVPLHKMGQRRQRDNDTTTPGGQRP